MKSRSATSVPHASSEVVKARDVDEHHRGRPVVAADPSYLTRDDSIPETRPIRSGQRVGPARRCSGQAVCGSPNPHDLDVVGLRFLVHAGARCLLSTLAMRSAPDPIGERGHGLAIGLPRLGPSGTRSLRRRSRSGRKSYRTHVRPRSTKPARLSTGAGFERLRYAATRPLLSGFGETGSLKPHEMECFHVFDDHRQDPDL